MNGKPMWAHDLDDAEKELDKRREKIQSLESENASLRAEIERLKKPPEHTHPLGWGNRNCHACNAAREVGE